MTTHAHKAASHEPEQAAVEEPQANEAKAKKESLKFGYKNAPPPVKAPPPPAIDWPKEQFTVCADWLANKETRVGREVAEAAYDVLGYALASVYDAAKAAPKGAGAPQPTQPIKPSDAESAFVLRGCGMQSGEQARAIDWNQVVAIVISIIQQFWK